MFDEAGRCLLSKVLISVSLPIQKMLALEVHVDKKDFIPNNASLGAKSPPIISMPIFITASYIIFDKTLLESDRNSSQGELRRGCLADSVLKRDSFNASRRITCG